MPLLDPFEDITQFKTSKQFNSAVSVYRSAVQNIVGAVITTVQFDTANFDVLGEFDLATFRFTPTRAGYYYITTGIAWGATAANQIYYIYLIRSAAFMRETRFRDAGIVLNWTQSLTALLPITSAQWLDVRVLTTNPGGGQVQAGLQRSWLDIVRVL